MCSQGAEITIRSSSEIHEVLTATLVGCGRQRGPEATSGDQVTAQGSQYADIMQEIEMERKGTAQAAKEKTYH